MKGDNSKKKIRGKSLQGTPFFISEDQKIGKGTYGQVYRVYNRQKPSQELVVKVISLALQDNDQSIETELEVLHQLPHHENLVNCFKAKIISSNNLYIVMEYCNQGSLQQYMKKTALISEHKIWDIIKQLCKGYQVLYDAHLLHRDIKPDNILIHNQVFKLADFGLSKKIKDHSTNENLSYAGSPLYIAPEIVDQHQGTSKIDVFSLGSVIYQLTYDGNSPFYKKGDQYSSPYEYYQNRKNKQLNLPPRNKKGEPRSQELRSLIKRMLEFDQEKRISWQEIFAHPKIQIDKLEIPLELGRMISHQEECLEQLRNSLQVVSRSSAQMKPIVERDNIREQSSHLTLELIHFEQFLSQGQLRCLWHEMFRLKITQLMIFHCNSKISYLVRENQDKNILHRHILDCLKRIVTEGLLFLLKVNYLMQKKFSAYEEKAIKQVCQLAKKDQQGIKEELNKIAKVFNLDLSAVISRVDKYDLRCYEDELYALLTEYIDYPLKAKEQVLVTVSILLDIYDSSLKLTQAVQSQKVVWQKYEDMAEIQTKMDQFCYNKLQPHAFHDYLLKKQNIKLQDNHQALKKLGLLFE